MKFKDKNQLQIKGIILEVSNLWDHFEHPSNSVAINWRKKVIKEIAFHSISRQFRPHGYHLSPKIDSVHNPEHRIGRPKVQWVVKCVKSLVCMLINSGWIYQPIDTAPFSTPPFDSYFASA